MRRRDDNITRVAGTSPIPLSLSPSLSSGKVWVGRPDWDLMVFCPVSVAPQNDEIARRLFQAPPPSMSFVLDVMSGWGIGSFEG